MIHLHTSKVFSDDLAKAKCVLSASTNDSAWHWYAHRITLMRKKCVIVMEEASRYALIFVGLKQKDFSHFDQILSDRILIEASWLCDLPQLEANKRLMAVLERKSTPVCCSQGLNRSVQAHIRQVSADLEYLVHSRFECLPESADEEIALGNIVNDILRKRGGDKHYFYPHEKWRESLLALLAPIK